MGHTNLEAGTLFDGNRSKWCANTDLEPVRKLQGDGRGSRNPSCRGESGSGEGKDESAECGGDLHIADAICLFG